MNTEPKAIAKNTVYRWRKHKGFSPRIVLGGYGSSNCPR